MWPLAALCVLALSWPAQPAASATGGTGTAAGAVAGKSAQVRADFNGDGFGDLVVGAPDDRLPGGAGDAHGTVSVLYGSASGITLVDQLWHRDRPGVKGIASEGFFGDVIAVGDFNGDRYDDLAASARGYRSHDDAPPAQHASINVIYGSARGLTARGDQLWSLATPGVKGIPGIVEFETLVAGDFNGDNRDDLVFDSQDQKSSTQIHMLPGSPTGLTADGDVLLRRSSPGVAGGGRFGLAMAVGNFDGDRDDDLAVAAFVDKLRGSVSVFYGGVGGISGERDQLWTAASPGVPGARRELANFGSVLTAGDFDGDTRDELAVLDGGDDTARVLVLRGTASGLTALGPTPVFRHSSSGMPRTKGPHRFGLQMAAGDATGDGRDDLAVQDEAALMPEQAPCVDESDGIGPGLLFVLQGSAHGLSTAGSQVVGASNLRFNSRTVPADVCLREIASELAFDDFDGDGYAELAMSYGAGIDLDLRGIAVAPGHADGPQVAHAALWRAETPWIKARCCFSTLAPPQRAQPW